jgi:hypothetical protein
MNNLKTIHETNLFSNLITITLEISKTLKELVEKNVISVKEYTWIKEQRFRVNKETGDITIEQGVATINYGFDYVSSASTLAMI